MKSKNIGSVSPVLTRKGSAMAKYSSETPNFSNKTENALKSEKNIKEFLDSGRKSIKESKSMKTNLFNFFLLFSSFLKFFQCLSF
jgi:hypothetical protein